MCTTVLNTISSICKPGKSFSIASLQVIFIYVKWNFFPNRCLKSFSKSFLNPVSRKCCLCMLFLSRFSTSQIEFYQRIFKLAWKLFPSDFPFVVFSSVGINFSKKKLQCGSFNQFQNKILHSFFAELFRTIWLRLCEDGSPKKLKTWGRCVIRRGWLFDKCTPSLVEKIFLQGFLTKILQLSFTEKTLCCSIPEIGSCSIGTANKLAQFSRTEASLLSTANISSCWWDLDLSLRLGY